MRVPVVVLRTTLCVLALAGLVGPAWGQAPNNPVGLWRVTAFNDAAAAMPFTGAQNVCFLANGTWFSPTFAGWGGFWFQKGNNAAGNGDRVRVFGNWANGAGNDSAELDFVHLRLMTGPWTEWIDNGGFNGFWLRVTVTRIGNCVAPAPAASFDAESVNTPPLTVTGTDVPACTEEASAQK
jgi:hypothetical protein